MIRDTSAQDARVSVAPGSRLKRRLLWIAVGTLTLLTSVALLSGWMGSGRSVGVTRLRMADVTIGTLVRDAAVNGRIVAAVSPTLYAPAASTVTLNIRAGDTVQKGDVLAILDSPDLSNQLKREQSSYEQLQAEVARQRILAEKQKLIARRDADESEILRMGAARDLQRKQLAYKAGAVSEVDFLKAQDILHSAEIHAKQAQLASALEIENVGLELKTRLSQLDRQRLVMADAQRRVDDLHVRSPVSGIVGTLSVANRSVVAINTPLMTVVDLSQLEVELEVPENYADDLGLGMSAQISIGAINATGKLSALSPEVVKNQVLARVRFDGAQPEGLRQSQRVSARILIEEKPGVMILARGPFIENEGGRFAYVVEKGMAVRRAIQVGATSIDAVEITGGLKPGDKVVIAGTDSFANAEKISIIN